MIKPNTNSTSGEEAPLDAMVLAPAVTVGGCLFFFFFPSFLYLSGVLLPPLEFSTDVPTKALGPRPRYCESYHLPTIQRAYITKCQGLSRYWGSGGKQGRQEKPKHCVCTHIHMGLPTIELSRLTAWGWLGQKEFYYMQTFV